MELDQFITFTGFTQKDADIITQTSLSRQKYERLRAKFEADTEAFLTKIRQQPNFRLDFLSFAVRYAIELYPLFKQKDISDTVYYDTFSDIAIWAENCRQSFGTAGVDNIDWISHSLKMSIFRLGRLQFEPTALSKSCQFTTGVLPAGTLVLNVHIPQGSPLTPNECKAAYQQAESFFRGISPAFFCHSWLLYPALAELLPANSNIRSFQSLYEILEIDETDHQAEERLFGVVSDNPALYPRVTTLQAKARKRLLSGRPLGSALGVYFPKLDTTFCPDLAKKKTAQSSNLSSL